MTSITDKQLVSCAPNYCSDNNAGQMVNPTKPTASSKSICSLNTCSDAFATYGDVETTEIFVANFPFACQRQPVGESGCD